MTDSPIVCRGPRDIAVALVIFRRPDTTSRVLSAIRDFGPSRLYVISDGPRENIPGESELVATTRGLIDTAAFECDVVEIFADANLGLRSRILSGLDRVFEHEQEVIILEDDCLPNQDFFRFSSELLERFRFADPVGLISGNNFASNSKMFHSYYFSTQAHIWGWATWARTWRAFRETKMEDFLTNEGQSEIAAAIPGRHQRRVFLQLLQEAKNLDSWAIQFSAFCYSNNLLSIVPKVNLVSNIGFGVESTHTKFESYVHEVGDKPLDFPLRHPETIEVNLGQMLRESRLMAAGWIIFPLLHPVDFVGRVIRYLKIRAS